jgi:hypothetical protein
MDIRVIADRFLRAAIGIALAFGATSSLAGQSTSRNEVNPMPYTSARQDRAAVTVTGRRMTQGNAVDCPAIVDSAGTLHPVSHLPATVAIGATVTVSGFIAITTKCNGPVLVVQTLTEAAG